MVYVGMDEKQTQIGGLDVLAEDCCGLGAGSAVQSARWGT